MKHYVKTDDGYIVADSNEIEFLNIEEDFHGRDLMTFNYKGKEYKSLVVIVAALTPTQWQKRPSGNPQ